MVTVHLTGRMGTEPILSIKRTVFIDKMINFGGDRERRGDGDGTCKQAFAVLLSTGQKNITTNVTRHAVAHAIRSLSLFCFGSYSVGQLSSFLLPPKGPFTLVIYITCELFAK